MNSPAENKPKASGSIKVGSIHLGSMGKQVWLERTDGYGGTFKVEAIESILNDALNRAFEPGGHLYMKPPKPKPGINADK